MYFFFQNFKNAIAHIINELICSWWVIAFGILTFGIYEQAAHNLQKEIEKLEMKQREMLLQIEKLQGLQEEKRLQIASQNDLDSIELSLMKGLGLVPEGYTKIVFQQAEKKDP